MKKIRNIIGRKTLVLSGQICIFLAVVLICAAMFPRQAHNFKYFYEIGKPWGYELLTAEKDFPIYKTDATLQKEREQVLRNYAPYYNIDLTIAQTQIDKILHSHSTDSLTDEERTYLYSKLHTIYAKGIIDPADIEQLTKDQQTRITLVDERRVASTVLVRECYTPRAAYSAVVDLAPIAYQTDLKRLNLNNDLQPNIVFDTITSQQVRQSLLDGISLTEGMVQAGAKIIDRGEIVTEYTAQILNSLSIDYLTNGGNSKQSLLAEIGDIALLCLFLVMLVVYLCVFRREWITDFRTLLFFALLIIIMVGISCLTLAVHQIQYLPCPVRMGAHYGLCLLRLAYSVYHAPYHGVDSIHHCSCSFRFPCHTNHCGYGSRLHTERDDSACAVGTYGSLVAAHLSLCLYSLHIGYNRRPVRFALAGLSLPFGQRSPYHLRLWADLSL